MQVNFNSTKLFESLRTREKKSAKTPHVYIYIAAR
jgi:hypothetical protein